MGGRNQTRVVEFVFLGFSGIPNSHIYLFLPFLAIYSVTVLGNLVIFALIQLDSSLRTPMYYFLSHLSSLDICISSVTVPKVLVNFLCQRQTISYNQCMAQMFFLISFTGAEGALLAVMAYDRYAAICKPLQYSRLMRPKVCTILALTTWIWGALDSALHTALSSTLSFCGVSQIPHILCDVPPLLKIACSDTRVNEIAIRTASYFVGGGPFLFIILSYSLILSSILKMHSTTGKHKAFSTCGSHLIVVVIYYGNAIVNYNRSSTGDSLETDTLVSIMYCMVSPMLNPLIYSLRNKEVKGAFRKVLKKWTVLAVHFVLSDKVSSVVPMGVRNQTQVVEFVFLGFSGIPNSHIYLFLPFLAIYSVTVLGNLMIFALIQLDSSLHTPMYYFLSHLSSIDICISSVTVPKILVNFLRQRQTISYNQCMAQMFFLASFTGTEAAMLAIMACDRYAAICKPLHYSHLMSSKVCTILAFATWIWGFLDSALHTALITTLSFCGVNQIPHILCDVPPLIKIACSNTRINEIAIRTASYFVGGGPFLFILVSYSLILSSILKMHSTTGKHKAFSTCASHLIIVIIYYGNALVNYNLSSAGDSPETAALVSIMFCMVSPMLNPIIYSLRNKEVKGALKKVVEALSLSKGHCLDTVIPAPSSLLKSPGTNEGNFSLTQHRLQRLLLGVEMERDHSLPSAAASYVCCVIL
ncbi:uncharacterized protein LOC132575833 [Heteronotia binoei]|uniref:uncharacterized protein LOC132575833 n=1 Tax=Heteronotia binoei TaxID=13085 RepID=UPI002931EF58|nr:uncharacterized protein LOC132575833 [Heteronotia binoei]